MGMVPPALETLLVLQDRDTRRLALETQLKAVPRDIAAVEQKIAAEKGAIETARTELKELETKKKLLETEIGSAEALLAKYRTQQLSVRKNDEYQALGHEIENTTKTIGELEGRELEVMYSIDQAKRTFATAEGVLKANISGHESRIRQLREREVSLAAELKATQAEVAAARPAVDAAVLRVYDRVSSRQMPACVPVRGSTCSGCHLKVSSEVEGAIRGRSDGKAVTCDQCGRIVWWEH